MTDLLRLYPKTLVYAEDYESRDAVVVLACLHARVTRTLGLHDSRTAAVRDLERWHFLVAPECPCPVPSAMRDLLDLLPRSDHEADGTILLHRLGLMRRQPVPDASGGDTAEARWRAEMPTT